MGAGLATCSGATSVTIQDRVPPTDLGTPAPERHLRPDTSGTVFRQRRTLLKSADPRTVTDASGNHQKPAHDDSHGTAETRFRTEVEGLFSQRTPRDARPKSARGQRPRQAAQYRKTIFNGREHLSLESTTEEDGDDSAEDSFHDCVLSIPDETKSPRRPDVSYTQDSVAPSMTCEDLDTDDWWTDLPCVGNEIVSGRSVVFSRTNSSCVSKKASERSISSVILIPAMDLPGACRTLSAMAHVDNDTLINNNNNNNNNNNSEDRSPGNNLLSESLSSPSLTGSLGLHNCQAPHPASQQVQLQETPRKLGEKGTVAGRPDSGIAVSSCASNSSETPREKDVDDVSVPPTDWITASLEMLYTILLVQTEHHETIPSLVKAITGNCKSEQLKAHALYRWLTSQKLEYYRNITQTKSTVPTRKLQQVAEGKLTYAGLYQEMSRAAGLQCQIISGYAKGQGYKPGSPVTSRANQHSWNAVVINDHYILVDAHFGAMPYKYFVEHYFMTPPDEFRLSHFPQDPKWLLMTQRVTIQDFKSILKTWPAMFAFNIRALNMNSVLKTYDGHLSITILLCNVAVTPVLEYEGPGPDIDSDTLNFNIDQEIRSADNAETFHVTLPQEGNYYFTLLVHDYEEDEDIPVLQYKVEYMDELL